MTNFDKIRDAVMNIRDAIKYDPEAPEMNETLDLLLDVAEAAEVLMSGRTFTEVNERNLDKALTKLRSHCDAD